ncbi:MAG: hypothetical protein ACYT04_53615 [Nostoc sp.]
MKVILKASNGEIVQAKDLIGVLEFPKFVLSQGHLYSLVEQNVSEATYEWKSYLHI